MMKFRSLSNGTSSRVKYELKTIKFRGRKVEKERVAIVKTRMNKRCSNSFSSVEIKSIANTSKITNKRETRFRYVRYMTIPIPPSFLHPPPLSSRPFEVGVQGYYKKNLALQMLLCEF